ncbi:hypothetical protein LOK49_Contig1G00020, partial [Camellia lanceoleosa]
IFGKISLPPSISLCLCGTKKPSLFYDCQPNPSFFVAGITNTTGKCYNYNNPNTICKDRDQYLNFDTVHPTQAANYVFSLNCFGGTLCSPLNIRTLVGA